MTTKFQNNTNINLKPADIRLGAVSGRDHSKFDVF